MSISIEVGKITVQSKDRLTRIDPENFEIEQFKRAIVGAVFSDGDARCEAKLIVDLRADTITISCDSQGLAAGRVGMALMVEYMIFTHSGYVIDTLGKNPAQMKEVGEFGIGPDTERFLGFLHHLHERGKTVLTYSG